jgi:5'-deoxynucleotidase YfbR-like HD superfamily hydrolase
MPDRKGAPARAWQRMLSGRRLDLLDPSPLDIEITDIAHGLARVSRWNGQTVGDHAFSVAQHSLLVEDIFTALSTQPTRQEQLAALLHDAAEYVIGDMISPFKAVMGGDYRLVEKRLISIAPLPAALVRAIKKADQIAACFEATRLAGFSEAEARTFFGRPRDITPFAHWLEPMPAVEAQARFLERFGGIDG